MTLVRACCCPGEPGPVGCPTDCPPAVLTISWTVVWEWEDGPGSGNWLPLGTQSATITVTNPAPFQGPCTWAGLGTAQFTPAGGGSPSTGDVQGNALCLGLSGVWELASPFVAVQPATNLSWLSPAQPNTLTQPPPGPWVLESFQSTIGFPIRAVGDTATIG